MNSSINENIEKIYINTGNLLASESLKRKVTLLPQEEIINGINLTINHWKCSNLNNTNNSPKTLANTEDKSEEKNVNIDNERTLILLNQRLIEKLIKSERNHYKIIVKIFIYNESCNVFKNAIDFILNQLEIDFIDSLIISLPPNQQKHTLEQIKPIWLCIEKIFNQQQALDIGITDLDVQQLRDLFNWAKSVKPTMNQINLDACCIIPPEMTAFANENNIKLLTHNDPRDFIPVEKFKEVLQSCGVKSANNWNRDWIARYSVMIKNKGIIKSRGYLLLATRT